MFIYEIDVGCVAILNSGMSAALTQDEIKKHNPDLNYTFTTHHEAIAEILSKWGNDIDKIDITGVKGKTSCAFMLKEIFIDDNPLLLSSLGALV